MWTDANVINHINVTSDYKLSNLFEKLIMKVEVESIGDYEYDTTGMKYTEIDIYDVSTVAIMEKYYELVDNAGIYAMSGDDNYKTPTISADLYNNPTFYPLILLINCKYSNYDFVSEGPVATYKALSKSVVDDILFNSEKKASCAVTEVKTSSEYTSYIKKMNNHVDKTNPTVDQLLKSKDKNDYDGIEDTRKYKMLLNKYGETKLTNIIMKLTTYKKK